ncbi:KPN_02809 family neutral zinc metallopeptidase [Oceanomicrobium pacificus]|uniref:Metalloprotease n=1 Tax=Oceanomicrobium pacificus TaxID=2692916 RepID=A0A6B0TWS6_9RHOB|nr:neutral zinc metallopeptidase [Oceanomicrobium pacificus]MXU65958.1 hypothetical protein [Oceanomicrobium pacificus]
MQWRGRRGSRNIEDRRGRRGGGMAVGGGGIGLILLLIVGWFFGVDMTPFVSQTGTAPQQTGEMSAADREAGAFVSVVLADTETIWSAIFQQELGRSYTPPVLVLYSGVTGSPCGGASGATGPFYCPLDRKIYLDTDFFVTMQRQLGAGGDFAAAYVVAHEVAHHVQDELGILGQVNRVRAQASAAESNALSIRIELQADCFSGIWARYADEALGTLDPGDVAEAMNAAKQIGDDMLQRNAGRVPMPHTFTHGTSAQRQRWFATGYQTGALDQCDTFGTDAL